MDIMRAVCLHEIRKAAGATDAGDGGDFFVVHLALFNQLEIKREHGEIAATGAPRRVIGGDFFFGQAFAFRAGNFKGGDEGDVATNRRFNNRFTHNKFQD